MLDTRYIQYQVSCLMSMELVITMKATSSELNSLNGKTKPNGEISYEDFLTWCDEDTWAEWVDGDIIIGSLIQSVGRRSSIDWAQIITIISFYLMKRVSTILRS